MTNPPEPRINRSLTLHLKGDWGTANLHRVCGWIGQELSVRCGPYTRVAVWNGRGGADNMRAVGRGVGRVVMTTSPVRALARDTAARALLLTPAGRRYLTEMRYRPQAVHSQGFVFGDHPLTGTQLPQPRVLTPDLSVRLLDDALGPEPVLLGVDVPEDAWGAELPGQPRRVDVVLDDRLPRPRGGRDAIADVDGRLAAALSLVRNRFVLVRPDRYVAAVSAPQEIPVLGERLAGLLAPAGQDTGW